MATNRFRDMTTEHHATKRRPVMRNINIAVPAEILLPAMGALKAQGRTLVGYLRGPVCDLLRAVSVAPEATAQGVAGPYAPEGGPCQEIPRGRKHASARAAGRNGGPGAVTGARPSQST